MKRGYRPSPCLTHNWALGRTRRLLDDIRVEAAKLSCSILILSLPRAGLAAVRSAVLQAEGLGQAGHLLLQVPAECSPHLPEGWLPPGQLQCLLHPSLAALQVPLETSNPYKRADIKLVMYLAHQSFSIVY